MADPQKEGYKGFGSFHVEESVEDLLRKPDNEYEYPALPFENDEQHVQNFEFGTQARSSFLLDFSWYAHLGRS